MKFTVVEEETMRRLYTVEMMSCRLIAEVVKHDPTTIAHHLRRMGVRMRTLKEANAAAYITGRNKRKRGENHHGWKGGRTNRGNGYLVRLISENNPYAVMASKRRGKSLYIPEHRLIMAEQLGRPLKPNEIVHHLNGIRDDNRPCNLAIVNSHNHENNTLVKLLQERIRNLESMGAT